jgi:hypothetical protein
MTTIPGLGAAGRSDLVKTGLRAVGTVALLLVLYYFLPIEHRAHQSVVIRLGTVFALFTALLINEIRLILIAEHPMLRAVTAMAAIIPFFVVGFAWIYLTMSQSDPAAFGAHLDRTSALYFTVSVLSTVGFGDIVPKTDIARVVVTIQMVADLAIIAIVIRLVIGAASRGLARKE